MWESSIDRALLENRKDAVLLVEVNTMTVIYQNFAAHENLGSRPGTDIPSIMSNRNVQLLLRNVAQSKRNKQITLNLVEDSPLTFYATPLLWEQKPVVMLSIMRRKTFSTPELTEALMQLLDASYFTIIQCAMPSMEAYVINAANPMLAAHPCFHSFLTLLADYAASSLHPADKEAFLTTFSQQNITLFTEGGPALSISVRRLHDGLYRWAKFSLAEVNDASFLFLGQDINEAYLEQERSEQYRRELKTLALRNSYILSSVNDIFRLMMHVNLKTGDTVICSLHPSLSMLFSYDRVYAFHDVADQLLRLVHPDDVENIRKFTDLTQYQRPIDDNGKRITLEYRRISRMKSLNDRPQPRWTRSVILLTGLQNGIPTEMIYAVQDIHERKSRELEAQHKQNVLSEQLYTLIQHRFVWFVECNYAQGMCTCWSVKQDTLQETLQCPFSRIFELMLIPHSHPDDVRRLAHLFLPEAVQKAYAAGQNEITAEYRHKMNHGWRWLRIEMYLSTDENGDLHSVSYASDIDNEKRQADTAAQREHEQLLLRRKLGMTVEGSYLYIGEIDLATDQLYHYRLQNGDYTRVAEERPFSRLSEAFLQHNVHPDHRHDMEQRFSYRQLLRTARERTPRVQQQFLFSPNGDGTSYLWCSMAVQFFCDENGKPFLMVYLENVDALVSEHARHLRKLEDTRERLRTTIRASEQAKVRKAHIFTNMISDMKLSLNQIAGSFDSLHQLLPPTDQSARKITEVDATFSNIQHMIERYRDILLLENQQLPLLHELTPLPQFLERLKTYAADDLYGRPLQLIAYTSHVRNENIYCDSTRLMQLLDYIFLHILRLLPNGTRVMFCLVERNPDHETHTADYEFSLTVYGDTPAEELQSLLYTPQHPEQAQHTMHGALFADSTRRNLTMHIVSKLILLMHGKLEFHQRPKHASTVLLRLPLSYAKDTPCPFPSLHLFEKRTLLFDSSHESAAAIAEMLEETRMRCDVESNFEQVCTAIRAAETTEPYTLLFVRQADLNATPTPQLATLQTLIGHATTILILADAPALPHTCPDPAYPAPHYLQTPLFRSTLAKQLRQLCK